MSMSNTNKLRKAYHLKRISTAVTARKQHLTQREAMLDKAPTPEELPTVVLQWGVPNENEVYKKHRKRLKRRQDHFENFRQ